MPDGRRRRGWIVALVVALVLAGLVIVADRGVQAVAENQIATQLQADLGASEKPTVDLGPFPFLTEIATGRVTSARVRLDEVELPNSNGATATGVDATFADITVSDQFSRIVAGHGEASGLLSYASLSALTGLDLSYGGPDRVQVDFVVPVGRVTARGTATGRPVLNVEDQTLEIADAEVSVVSTDVPQAVVDAAGRLLLRAVPLTGLPYDLRLTAMTVRADGVQVTASGHDLPLRG